MFNYNHLYYFYVTARLGGVSNAAKFLHISQPSLSSQLKIFEASIEQKLFEKKGRRLQLTPDGQKAFLYSKKIFDAANEFAEALKSPVEKLSQRLRIGVTDQVERPFIADLLSPLIREQKKGGQRAFYVNSAPTDALVNQLRSDEIDLVLTNKPIYADDVAELCAARLPVNLVVSSRSLKEAKLRVAKNASPADLLQTLPWGLIIPSYKLKLRHETDAFFQQINARKNVVLETDILSIVGRAIFDGAGMGFLPLPYVYEEMKSGYITALGPKAGYWKHTLYLLGRKNSSNHPMIEELRKIVKKLEKPA